MTEPVGQWAEPVLHGEAVYAEDLIGAIEDSTPCPLCTGALLVEVVHHAGDENENEWFIVQGHAPDCPAVAPPHLRLV
jgi:hypothetical protein